MKQINKTLDRGTLIRLGFLAVLVVVMFSIMQIHTTFTKYNDEGQGADDARVAKWSVNVTDEEGSTSGWVGRNLEFTDSSSEKVNASYKFTTQNTRNNAVCETACAYDVTVTLPEGKVLPEGITIYIMDGDTRINPEAGTTYTFKSNNWTFEPARLQTHDLTLVYEMDRTCKSTGEIDGITISVNYSQI